MNDIYIIYTQYTAQIGRKQGEKPMDHGFLKPAFLPFHSYPEWGVKINVTPPN